MKVNINGLVYEILEVNEDDKGLLADDDRYHFGICRFKEQKIYIMDNIHEESKKKVLIHELTHAYINCYGMVCKESYTDEELCEFIAYNAESILNIANEYFKKRG